MTALTRRSPPRPRAPRNCRNWDRRCETDVHARGFAADDARFHRGRALKALDPRVRGDDDFKRRGETDSLRNPPAVMRAKAGIQGSIEAWL
ncbi:hypothetical protein [Lysobacter enzymogenes]|uniref:hypothetical protein n=1 Tax=Lysobacter enzymogenes TaxID=69 RepID=UPI0019CFE55D|nr:hypothetical protein [Lysobacter enzymogenes]